MAVSVGGNGVMGGDRGNSVGKLNVLFLSSSMILRRFALLFVIFCALPAMTIAVQALISRCVSMIEVAVFAFTVKGSFGGSMVSASTIIV